MNRGTWNLMVLLVVLGVALTTAPQRALAASAADTCEAGKLGITAKYAQCRLKADAKAAKSGAPADYSKCDLTAFALAEYKAGTGVCPTSDDQAAVANFVDACTDGVAAGLAGGDLPLDVATCNSSLASCQAATCGNARAEFGETCDGIDLHGATCASVAPGTPYGTLSCNGSCSGFVTTSCEGRFVDNGDGTLTDHATHLMWEIKDALHDDAVPWPGNANDPDNVYSWSALSDGVGPTGTVFTDFLAKLNGIDPLSPAGCYAGHCDWRLPSTDEMAAFPYGPAPGIGPVVPEAHWSNMASTFVAYTYDIVHHVVDFDDKTNEHAARGVRSVP